MDRTCSVEGCGRKHSCRGYCTLHYQRWRQYGTPAGKTRPTTCTVDGCGRAVAARGWCDTHYRRWKRLGTTELPSGETRVTARFWSHVDQSENCWNWTSYVTERGYGRFFDGRAIAAHRFAYELLIGPIPTDREIDHVCHNRKCVNPDHLRLVTRKQNQEHRIKPNSNSRSGVRGVYWFKPTQRWCATVGHNHQRICVGYFDTIEEAEAAVIAKRKELFTHNDADRVSA